MILLTPLATYRQLHLPLLFLRPPSRCPALDLGLGLGPSTPPPSPATLVNVYMDNMNCEPGTYCSEGTKVDTDPENLVFTYCT